MKKHIQADVAILGAGISGLAAAFFLKRKGRSVCVIEKNAHTGGAIRSERREGFLIEYGPNSTLDTTPLLHELFSGLQIADQLEYANDRAKNRYIVRNGRLNTLPLSPPAFIKSKLFSASAKFRLLKEPFVRPAPPEADESLADFVRRRLGQEFLDYAINPFVAGVYAGKPETLSVQSAFPKLHRLVQEYGSLIKGAVLGAKKRRKSAETSKSSARLLSFKEGLQTVVNALERELSGSIFSGSNIESVRRRDNFFEIDFRNGSQIWQLIVPSLLFTIPAHQYAFLPLEFEFPLLHEFQNIYYPPVAMVYFGYKNQPPGVPLDGFGFLVPEKENRQILGTIWSSTIFSNRAPRGGVALTTFVGGSRQPENALLPEEKLIDLVRRDIQELMGIREKPDLIVVRKWEKAIPQYRLGHRQIMENIDRFEQQTPGLFISGNFRGGISVSDCIKQSHLMSERIDSFLTVGKEAALEAVSVPCTF